MSRVWVVNASPVITLAKIGPVRLLENLSDSLLLPEAVANEILAGPETDMARTLVMGGWAQRVKPKTIPDSLLEWGLGAGETQVLAIALEQAPATAILDDAAARAAARTMGIPIIGTLGVVLRARQQGLIPSAGELIRELQRVGLYLDPQVIQSVLGKIGEPWPIP